MAAARLGWPRVGSSVLFLCDLQEQFRGSIVAFPQIVAVAARMLQQTALDLLERGLDVHVVADAVSSRSQAERALALSRMRQAGAYLSTCESLLLLLLRDAAHPKFKQILPMIKDPPPDTGLILGGPLGVLGGP
ncbi:isochorismatase domain-containing protein 2 isoform X2 [Ammospiza caudacuta]|uniref:isochorismatase domain-containing protein 2 isoform X2 n=1 Tax=Ammospiza caudacuta TaxID=2857398 RepID=UPI002738485B|nr:isochorismatase domain-containing protein 2 isoform X2 [Ammospiza caudacuta]